MNTNLLMLCFKAIMKGDTRMSSGGALLSTWEFAAARANQLKEAIELVPDEPEKALVQYFRAKDCLVSDFSILADLFESTKTFEVNYDELKEQFTIELKDNDGSSIVTGSRDGFVFIKNEKHVGTKPYSEAMTLENMLDIVVPFFVIFE